MHSMVIIVTLLSYISKVAKTVDLKCSHYKKEMVFCELMEVLAKLW